jgi:hypothetical protein
VLEGWLPPHERWRAYADTTAGPDFTRWCAEHCVQSDDRFADRPLEIEGFQRDVAAEILAELEEARVDAAAGYLSYWHVCALLIPKGNGKSTLAAALALYELVTNPGAPQVLLAAATDRQAGHLFNTAVRFVKRDAWLSARLHPRPSEGKIDRMDGFGSLHRISGDMIVAGYNPSLVVIDELKDWRTPGRRTACADLISAGRVKRGQSRVVIISTAGEATDRASSILGQILDDNERNGVCERVHRALMISRDHRSRTLVYNYCADTTDPFDIDAIGPANPASWVTREKLTELAHSPTMPGGRFLQLHGDCWVNSAGAYLGLEEWQALERPGVTLESGDEILVGLHAGAGSYALVACRRSDGTLFTLAIDDPETPWLPAQATVDRQMRLAAKLYRVGAIYASPNPNWDTLVDTWRRELGLERRRIVDFRIANASPRTSDAVRRFAADARAGLVGHDGDRRLAAHMLAAQLTTSERDYSYLTADTRYGTQIAGALAAVLAWEAMQLTDPEPPPLKIDVSAFRIVAL